ncbi:MAG: methionine synthase [Thermoplasmata archaeon]|nr:methionine synthase [Thermoplasmata archaeon]
MRLATTVVGSLPHAPSADDLLALHEGLDPFSRAIEGAVTAQLDAGIDLVSDGQLRAGMVAIFASGLRGIRMKDRPEVIADIEWHAPITVEDVSLADEMARARGAAAKGIVTGPFTMAMSVRDRRYGSVEALAWAFAEALNHEVLALQEVARTVQVDEPFFSVEFPEYAPGLVETVFRGASCERALHVCGDVGPIFADLVEMPVDLLDHEFYKQEGLLPLVARHDFGQRLGYGSIDTASATVERAEDVAAHIERALEVLPAERIVLDPDCGMRHLPGPVAQAKLEVLVEAARRVERRYDG